MTGSIRSPIAARLAWFIVPALVAARPANAQLLGRYFPANIPAYQDWGISASTPQSGDDNSAQGILAGSFVISPNITESLGYNSNPFAAPVSRGTAESDTSGAVSINSNWARNAVNAAFTVERMQYLSFPAQSVTNWTASAGSVIDYADDEIDIGYSHIEGVTLPTDIGSFGLQQPVIDQVDDLRFSDTIGPGPLILVPALVGQIYTFNTVGGGQSMVGQDLFNRDEISGSITAGYAFSGGHNIIVVVNDKQVGYTSGQLPQRPADYNDVSILAGIEYQQSALWAYRALVGYEVAHSTSSGAERGTISAPAAELDIIWKPTVWTTLTGKISQSIENEPVGASQALTLTQTGLTLDHSLRRDLSFEASLEYDHATLRTGGMNQASFGAGAQANWTISRNWMLSLRYEFTKANGGSGTASQFDVHQIFLQAKFQM